MSAWHQLRRVQACRIWLLFVLPLLALVPAWAAEPLTIKAMRLWQAPDNTRIVFDISAHPQFDVNLLDNPHRLVIDIKQAKLGLDLTQVALGSALVSKVRDSTPVEAGAVRVVFELTSAVKQKTFALKPFQQYGDRLVVDLSELTKTPSTTVPASAQVPVAGSVNNSNSNSVNNSNSNSNAGTVAAASVVDTVKNLEPAPMPTPAPAPAKLAPKATTAEANKNNEKRDVIVAIDAGHGGDDPGAIGPKKTQEKNVTLAIAKRLAEKINSTSGMKAVLTRSGDYFVALRQRTMIAREKRADLFVSIHADSFKDKSVTGASVWALSHKGAKSEMGRWLEEKETASDLLGGEDSLDLAKYDDDVARVLLDLSMYNAVGSSLDVGAEVLQKMKGVVPRLHKPSVQQAGFVVLKNPDIPAILVETAFLSNPKEEQLLLNEQHQEKLATAILAGMKTYFHANPPDGSRFADAPKRRVIVAKGDTLASVARRYDISMQKLRTHNGLGPQALEIGQIIDIP